ncbi:hypothetical protein G9A89_004493 [Geosiphon pyriformis]|nr:hypothetical protein G9A89_004493 [Geosiphon pyriformis]
MVFVIAENQSLSSRTLAVPSSLISTNTTTSTLATPTALILNKASGSSNGNNNGNGNTGNGNGNNNGNGNTGNGNGNNNGNGNTGNGNGNNNGNGNTGNGNGNNNGNGNGNGNLNLNCSHNNNCGTSSGNDGKDTTTNTPAGAPNGQYNGPWTTAPGGVIWGKREKVVKRDLDVGQATPTPDSQQLSSPAMQKSIGSTATLQSIPTQDSNSKTTETSLEPKSTNKVSASAETSKPNLINFQMFIYLGIAITDWVYYHLFD